MNVYLHRTYVFDVRCSRRQRTALAAILTRQRGVYNAALEEWVSAYRWACLQAVRLGLATPSKTALKTIDRDALDPERQATFDRLTAWTPPNWYSQSAALTCRAQRRDLGEIVVGDPSVVTRWTLMRLELARRAFFDRIKAGRKAGFPRFRAASRWATIGWQETAGRVVDQPLELLPGVCNTGHLTLPGVPGKVSVCQHRPLPEGAEIRAATMSRRGTRWRVALSCRVPATHGVETDAMLGDLAENEVMGIDWGIATLATGDDGDAIANTRSAMRAVGRVRRAQRAVARSKRGARRRVKRIARLAKAKRQEADARRTALRQGAARVVGGALTAGKRVVALECLQVANMTRSARGSSDAPGHNVRAKSGLNRSILDAAPAAFVAYVQAKAESAGLRTILVDPKGTSIRCSSCGIDVPKRLSQRIHRCACGVAMDRDRNAALNIRYRGWQAALRAAATAVELERKAAIAA